MSNLEQATDSYAAEVHEMRLSLWKVWHEALQLEQSDNPRASHLYFSANFSRVTHQTSPSLCRRWGSFSKLVSLPCQNLDLHPEQDIVRSKWGRHPVGKVICDHVMEGSIESKQHEVMGNLSLLFLPLRCVVVKCSCSFKVSLCIYVSDILSHSCFFKGNMSRTSIM